MRAWAAGVYPLRLKKGYRIARPASIRRWSAKRSFGGLAQSRVLELHGQRMLDQNYEPGFRTRLYPKDMGIVTETGRALGVPLLGASLAAQLYQLTMSRGLGEQDYSVLAKVVGELGGP